MKVTDILKGKKMPEKLNLLDDKTLDSEIVDKLASGAGKEVKIEAFNHPNVTQDGLWKAAISKSTLNNIDILIELFDFLDSDNILKWFENDHELIIKTEKSYEQFTDYILKACKEEKKLLDLFVKKILKNDNHVWRYIEYVARLYPVKKNKKLFDWFTANNPQSLIKWHYLHNRRKQTTHITDKDSDILFKEYVKQNKNNENSLPEIDLGYSFPNTLSAENLTSLIQLLKTHTIIYNDDYLSHILKNKNFNSSHTELLLSVLPISYSGEGIHLIAYEAPLNKAAEESLLKQIKPENNEIKELILFNNWLSNPTHDKSNMKKILNTFDHSIYKNPVTSYNNSTIDAVISSKIYSGEELDEILDAINLSEMDKIQLYTSSSANLSETTLRKLWEEYWVKNFKKKELKDNLNFATFNDRYITDMLLRLLTDSKLSDEFGAYYFEVHHDKKYLPQEAKDVFLF
jgi:hypothetical protein